MKSVRLVVFVFCLGAGLAGCGQKGPLYLPADNTTSTKTPQHVPTAKPAPHPDQNSERGQSPETAAGSGDNS
jgi:predicted small lipoprotein YifL